MRTFLPLITAVLVTQSFALHIPLHARATSSKEVLLFDALGFTNPHNPQEILAGIQAFAFHKEIDTTSFASALTTVLKPLGIGTKVSQFLDRAKLFAAGSISGEHISVEFPGCGLLPPLPATARGGMALANVPVTHCHTTALTSSSRTTVNVPSTNGKATIFFSPPDGFGVISDIDDTVKITNVLHPVESLENTFIHDPQPVAGMPALYASLAKSLHSPQFTYVSGGPSQLYPFLHQFINTVYSASPGPILLQNVTVSDVSTITKLFKTDEILEYKTEMIDRINGMYPKKKFLLIGDSTQKDPETYGEAIRKHGNFVACAWIRQVEGAVNTPERFTAAFQGVEATRYRIFKDSEIPSLSKIDVAGGKC